MPDPRTINLADVTGPVAAADTTGKAAFRSAAAAAAAAHTHGIADLPVGTAADEVASGTHNHSGVYEPVQTRVTSGEKTAGTELAVRSFSPDDIKDMIAIFAPGSSVIAPTIASIAISPTTLFTGQEASLVIDYAPGTPPAVLTLAWLSNDIVISGATAFTFTATFAEAGLDLEGRATLTPPTGDPVVLTSTAIVPIGQPEDIAGTYTWVESDTPGLVYYDASALFIVPGDVPKATLTYSLPEGDAVFVAGAFDTNVFEGGALPAPLFIDPDTGIITMSKGDIGELDAAALYVRATNAAGYADALISVTVTAVEAAAIGTAHIAASSGGAVITTIPYGDLVWAVANTVTGVPAPTLTYQWKVDGANAGGVDDEESFDPFAYSATDVITVVITATNGTGSDNATSAGCTITSTETAVLWNSADKHSGVVLSDGDRVAKTTANAAECVRATKYLTSADTKCYLELAIEGAILHATGGLWGVVTNAAAASNISIAVWSDDAVCGQCGMNVVYEDGADQGASGTGSWNTVGEILCIAINMTLGKMWIRNTAGSWTGDPVAGTGGYDIVASSVTVMVGPRRNTGEPNVPGVRLRSLTSEFTQAVPTGFVSYAAA